MGARKVSKTWWMALLLVVFVAACGRERGTLAPTLTSISPNSGVQGQTVGVTLTGTNFATGATVGVGGALITVTNATVVSSTQITATFAIAANATPGAVSIRVTSSDITTNAVPFSIMSGLAVNSTSPADGAAGVAVNQTLTATFSETLNCATVTASTFTVAGPGGTPVTGVVSCSGTTATFTPAGVLASNTLYTATLTTGITDAEGDPLAGNFVMELYHRAPSCGDFHKPHEWRDRGADQSATHLRNLQSGDQLCNGHPVNLYRDGAGRNSRGRNNRLLGFDRRLYLLKRSCHQHPLYRHDYDRGDEWGRRTTGGQLCVEL